MYYSNCPMTLYLQVHFLKLKCTENVKSTMKNAMKSEKKKKISSLKKQISPSTKKMQEDKEKSYRDPKSRKQYQKQKYQENPE